MIDDRIMLDDAIMLAYNDIIFFNWVMVGFSPFIYQKLRCFTVIFIDGADESEISGIWNCKLIKSALYHIQKSTNRPIGGLKQR